MIMAYMSTPSAQISIFGSLWFSPCSNSGDIYLMLPALCLSATVPLLEPKMPKSAILTWILDGAVSLVGS